MMAIKVLPSLNLRGVLVLRGAQIRQQTLRDEKWNVRLSAKYFGKGDDEGEEELKQPATASCICSNPGCVERFENRVEHRY